MLLDLRNYIILFIIFSILVPKNVPSKTPSSKDQLPSKKFKLHRQYLCLPKRLSYWPSGFYEEHKGHYSLHPKSPILWQSVTTTIESHFIFIKNSKKLLDMLKNTNMFSTSLVLSCAKTGKAMTGSGGQKWPSKLTTNFEKGDRGRSLTIFITDRSYQQPSQSPNYLESSIYCM